MLEEYLGAPHVRCVSSCTAALLLGLRIAGVGPGDEVLVPAMTFVASANAVEHVGATPVFVDCEPGTGLIDLDAAEAAITPRTRAIMPVHLAGRPVDLDRLERAARPSRPARHRGRRARDRGRVARARGSAAHGNLAAYSFYATKNITTIEGGALAPTTADRRARSSGSRCTG